MTYNWRCRHCDFVVWSERSKTVQRSIQDHLLDHHRQRLTANGFQVNWNCPYCDEYGSDHDEAAAKDAFATHLGTHMRRSVRTGTHVADEVDGLGNVLVLTPPESTGASSARSHFLTRGDIAIVITASVTTRLQLIEARLGAWPEHTIVVTTKHDPLADIGDVELSAPSLEVVQLDKGLGLSGIGETISRIIAEHNGPETTFSVAFDILTEIIHTFELEQVFRFIHLLNSRFDSAEALSHYYCNPESNSGPTLNVLRELFDLRITATSDRLVLDS
ncbi:hypothetical protein ACLI4Z_18680 [Natrialbaceae archaeon A-arb3/5]